MVEEGLRSAPIARKSVSQKFIDFLDKRVLGRYRFSALDSALTGKDFVLHNEEALKGNVKENKLLRNNPALRHELEQIVAVCSLFLAEPGGGSYSLDEESSTGLTRIAKAHPNLDESQKQRLQLLKQTCNDLLEENPAHP